ncbi:MAG: hypothetical protein HQL99_05855 [Magnetococcales bacterium]|nr:hypothetical protein [Magnetococcales bacterium]
MTRTPLLPIVASVPELFRLMAEQCQLTERMAVLLEHYLQCGDLALVETIQRLEQEGARLRQRNVEWLKGEPALVLDRGAMLQACFFAEALQGSLVGIVLDMDGMGVRGDWSILEMTVQLRHAVERLQAGHERLRHAPAEVGSEIVAIFTARKAMERSYRLALARLLVGERELLQTPNAESLQRILHLFRHREIYRRIRDAGIEIANCGRVLQDIALQFA